MQKVGGGGGNGGAISAPFFFANCFALLVLCVLIVPDKAREGLYMFASVYVYWMERVDANSGH
jgi:hypothetical protein